MLEKRIDVLSPSKNFYCEANRTGAGDGSGGDEPDTEHKNPVKNPFLKKRSPRPEGRFESKQVIEAGIEAGRPTVGRRE